MDKFRLGRSGSYPEIFCRIGLSENNQYMSFKAR
jgi:hypothetical protein